MASNFRLNDSLNDTIFVDLKNLQTPKFFDEIDNKHLSKINKTLTLYYNDEMLNNNNRLFYITCNENDTFNLIIPAVLRTSYGEAYFYNYSFIQLSFEILVELLPTVYEYCLNNPFLFCAFKLRYTNKDVYNDVYTQTLINACANAFKDLELIIQATNI
jgi:hypothetical protein